MANPQALQIAGQASHLLGKSADAINFFEKYLEDVMAKGAAEAKQNAARTMSKVRRKIGFIEARRPF